MKKIFLCIGLFLCIQFFIVSEELSYEVISDTRLSSTASKYFESEEVLNILKKGEIVVYSNNCGILKDDYNNDFRLMIGYFSYSGKKYWIASNDLMPTKTGSHFNHLFITDYNSRNRKTWIPSYYTEVIKDGRDILPRYESFWADPYNPYFVAGEGELLEWYEAFFVGTPITYNFSFSHSLITFYNIPFAIKNINKISNGYNVTVKFGKPGWRMYKLDTYDWSSVENKEFFDLRFVVDGDYMDMYLEDGNEPFITFISVDLNFLEQFSSRIKDDTADLSKVVFPRRGHKTAVVGEIYKTTDNLRLRDKAGTGGNIITTLSRGTEVKILEVGRRETIEKTEASWVRVSLETKKQGWVFGGYLETLPE